MNEELTVAIEELRARPRDQVWFLPVVLPGGQVPDWPISAVESLRDINYTVLTHETWSTGMQSLIRAIRLSLERRDVESSADERSLRESARVLDRDEFDTIRAQICASGPPSDGDNLLGMEIDCSAYFGGPAYADDETGIWHDMQMRRLEGAEWLISGRAVGKQGDATAIAAELSRIWDQHLKYHYRSAHTVSTAADAVTLRAVTQIGPGDIWVTADVQVALT